MTTTPYPAAGRAAGTTESSFDFDRFPAQDAPSQRQRPLLRRYEIAHLTADNQIHEGSRLAPDVAPFEDSFAAIGRGAIVQTSTGPCAVEDLLPGDMVITASHGLQKLLWRGSMIIVPGAQNKRAHMGTMTRVTTDALGYRKPAPDLVLGPAARICHKASGILTLTGSEAAFVPVRDFIDGSTIVELTPIAPVHCYQLGFEDHCRLNVNGIEIESLHPGPPHAMGLRSDMLSLLLSMFPHKETMADFGAMLYPRINLRDLNMFEVA